MFYTLFELSGPLNPNPNPCHPNRPQSNLDFFFESKGIWNFLFILNCKKKKKKNLVLFGGGPRNEYDEARNSIIKISYFSFSKKKKKKFFSLFVCF